MDGKQKAECHACKSLLSGESNHGTTHLHDHLKSCKKRKQPDIRERLLYPLSIVDHVGFRNFTKAIQPLFNCPCRNTLKNDILKLYNQQKDQVIKGIETNKSRVDITADMWTSSNQKKGFMAITGHYIDNDWILRSKILRFLYVPCPHTSEVLTNVLMEALMEWNVDTKLSTITLDNCSTNDKLIDMGAIHELMAVASVFDPRSKMEMIEFYFPQIYPDDSASRIKKVRKICEALILEYQEKTLDREYEFGNNTGSSSANSMEVDENMSA
ncbi:zinc finger BED domain-containing protein RICESLEEPER 2-like protein [Tanacetum coccineum]